jgi:hypothetical protein
MSDGKEEIRPFLENQNKNRTGKNMSNERKHTETKGKLLILSLREHPHRTDLS